MKPLSRICLVLLVGIQSVFTFAQQNDILDLQRNKNGKITSARFQPSNARRLTDGPRFLKKLLGTKESHEFRLLIETTDDLGFVHQRYNQFYKGVRIDNADYLVHGRNGLIETINGEFPDIDSVHTSPTVNEAAALTRATGYVGAKKYKWEDANLERLVKEIKKDSKATYYPTGELVFAMESLKGTSRYTLSWKFTISSLMPENEQIIYVNAINGEIIADIPLLCNINIACVAQTRYSGTQNITGDTFAGGNRLRETRNTTAGNTANVVTLNIQNGFNYATAIDFANNTTPCHCF
jgi:bacillolysin